MGAIDVQVLLAAGPAFVSLTRGSGQLRLNADRIRSGSLSGQFGLGGVAGSVSIAIDGFGNLAEIRFRKSKSKALSSRRVPRGIGQVCDLYAMRRDSLRWSRPVHT